MDAAQHWARGGVKDDTASDLAAFGAPVEMIQSIDTSKDDFEVWEDNMDAMVMFLKLQTQWVVIEGGFIGLNYQSVQFLFTIGAVANQAEMMDDLQAMEMAALQVLNKRKD